MYLKYVCVVVMFHNRHWLIGANRTRLFKLVSTKTVSIWNHDQLLLLVKVGADRVLKMRFNLWTRFAGSFPAFSLAPGNLRVFYERCCVHLRPPWQPLRFGRGPVIENVFLQSLRSRRRLIRHFITASIKMVDWSSSTSLSSQFITFVAICD